MVNWKSCVWVSRAVLLLPLWVAGACADSDAGDATDGADAADGTAGDDGAATTPVVTSNAPSSGAVDVPLNGTLTATFSEAMNPGTLTPSTFTLVSGTTTFPGVVTCTGRVATFWPSAHLAGDSTYTATVTTGARSAAGVPLAADFTWSFTTGDTVLAPLPVDLGAAGGFVLLAKSGISTVPSSAVTGDVGISPAAASFITGFSLVADSTNGFSTSPQVTGRVYAADHSPPTPSNLTTAIGDLELAFTAAAGRAADVTELGAGNIGGMTLAAGVYRWSTGLLIPTDVVLSGSATDVWIFQIAQNLTLAGATRVELAGGAVPENVFWQVGGFVQLGTTAHCEGILLSQTSITLQTGATVNGRLLAQTAVVLDANEVVEPAR